MPGSAQVELFSEPLRSILEASDSFDRKWLRDLQWGNTCLPPACRGLSATRNHVRILTPWYSVRLHPRSLHVLPVSSCVSNYLDQSLRLPHQTIPLGRYLNNSVRRFAHPTSHLYNRLRFTYLLTYLLTDLPTYLLTHLLTYLPTY